MQRKYYKIILTIKKYGLVDMQIKKNDGKNIIQCQKLSWVNIVKAWYSEIQSNNKYIKILISSVVQINWECSKKYKSIDWESFG